MTRLPELPFVAPHAFRSPLFVLDQTNYEREQDETRKGRSSGAPLVISLLV